MQSFQNKSSLSPSSNKVNIQVNKTSNISYRITDKPISDLERSRGRSENYYQLSPLAQWEENNKLGLLGWKPEEE